MQVQRFRGEDPPIVKDPFPRTEEPVTLAPYLRGGLHYRLADVLYRGIFQPIFDLAERINAYFTRRWCEENTPQ